MQLCIYIFLSLVVNIPIFLQLLCKITLAKNWPYRGIKLIILKINKIIAKQGWKSVADLLGLVWLSQHLYMEEIKSAEVR